MNNEIDLTKLNNNQLIALHHKVLGSIKERASKEEREESVDQEAREAKVYELSEAFSNDSRLIKEEAMEFEAQKLWLLSPEQLETSYNNIFNSEEVG